MFQSLEQMRISCLHPGQRQAILLKRNQASCYLTSGHATKWPQQSMYVKTSKETNQEAVPETNQHRQLIPKIGSNLFNNGLEKLNIQCQGLRSLSP